MHKRVFGRKFSRDHGSRAALLRALSRAFIKEGKIKTTSAKAKGVQRDIEKLMTLVRKNTVPSRRLALSRLGNDHAMVEKLFKEMK